MSVNHAWPDGSGFVGSRTGWFEVRWNADRPGSGRPSPRGLTWIFAAAVSVVKTLGVGLERFQTEFGAEINRAALVFGAVIVFGRDGHDPSADQAGWRFWR